MHWYNFTKIQIENELQTNSETGLTQEEATNRFLKFGGNTLPEKAPDTWILIFFRQFKSSLIYILVVCALIIYFTGDRQDSLIILAVLIFNAVIGALQEGKGERALRALKKLSAVSAIVLRNGEEKIIPEEEIVRGDVLVLREGQKVSADSRIIRNFNLSVDEAMLTGESGGVEKTDIEILDKNVQISGQKNMLFKGTNILTGSGFAIVCAIGKNTEMGKISNLLLTEEEDIPLKKNIKQLSKLIIFAVGFLSAGLFFLGILLGKEAKEMFAIVVSLAVSIIPEGLPLVLTLILVTGVRRMSKKNALVKKLQAVEALGQAEVIAVDKTGTITKNEMVVKRIFSGGRFYEVSGNGYAPEGALFFKNSPIEIIEEVKKVIVSGVLASAGLARFSENEGLYKVSGDPTEASITVLGEKFGLSKDVLLEEAYKPLLEIPFDYKQKIRAHFYEQAGNNKDIFCAVIGAPEAIFARSANIFLDNKYIPLNKENKLVFEKAVESFAEKGLRTVAVGFKLLKKMENSLPTELTLAGIFGIEDAVREESKVAVLKAQNAGVRVVMITGDHKITAVSIAREAGIYKEGDNVMTGDDLNNLESKKFIEIVKNTSVFARVSPEDKLKIIKAYKQAGLIVAMTGDGVNDAPSLVSADLGVAMGKIGTEVAKEASDIVLLDDNLNSIVSAIEEGRNMHQNIKKSLLFLFSTSLGELFTIVFALVLGMPLPILAVQILWLNLVTDPLIGTGLALTKKDPNLLMEKFKKLPKYFVDNQMFFQMLIMSLVMATGTLVLFNFFEQTDYAKAVTISLTTLAVFQWFNGLNCQSFDRSIFSLNTLRNYYLIFGFLGNLILQVFALYIPFLSRILKTTPLSLEEWGVVLGVGFLVVVPEEIRKMYVRFVRKSKVLQTV